MTGKTTIHFVRHAQGYHNLNHANHQIPDPSLTPHGEAQCASLQSLFERSISSHKNVTHLIVSPLRRTIYTCLLSFTPAVKNGIKVIALPELQETSDLPCDTGSDVEDLKREFEEVEDEWKGVINWDAVEADSKWNIKAGKYEPSPSALEERARLVRVYLRNLAEEDSTVNSNGDKEIVVVTHGALLHYLSEDWVNAGLYTGTGWANVECRSFEFADKSGVDRKASFEELKESRLRRKGHEVPLGEEEQRELKRVAHDSWAEAGFQIKTILAANLDAKL